MNNNLTLSWPRIHDRYTEPLHAAVDYILEEFQPIGIILGGSVLGNNTDPNSDFDIVIIHEKPNFSRSFKIFKGIPTDLLINTPFSIMKHLDFQNMEPEPKMAHMLATGFKIMGISPVIDKLIDKAKQYLKQTPYANEQELTRLKYLSVNYFADAKDTIKRDPSVANLLLTLSVNNMIKFFYRSQDSFIPQSKDLIEDIRKKSPNLGAILDCFFTSGDESERAELALRVARETVQDLKFFEWQNKATESQVL